MCNFPGPTGASKCPLDSQLIEQPTENLLFATMLGDKAAFACQLQIV